MHVIVDETDKEDEKVKVYECVGLKEYDWVEVCEKLFVCDRLVEKEDEKDGVNVTVRVIVGTKEGDFVKVDVVERLLLNVDENDEECEMVVDIENVNEWEMVCAMEGDRLRDTLEVIDVVDDKEADDDKEKVLVIDGL